MNKLRSNQIFAVLLGSAAFPLLCRTEPFTIEGIFGAAIAIAVGLPLSSYSRPHRKFPCPFRKSFWRRH